MQSSNHHVQRPLQPIEEFDRLVVGNDPEAALQIARQRLAHVYEATALQSWTYQDMLLVGAFLVIFWSLLIGSLYLLTPYIVRWVE